MLPIFLLSLQVPMYGWLNRKPRKLLKKNEVISMKMLQTEVVTSDEILEIKIMLCGCIPGLEYGHMALWGKGIHIWIQVGIIVPH